MNMKFDYVDKKSTVKIVEDKFAFDLQKIINT